MTAIKIFRSPLLSAHPEISHGFFGRTGGVSSGVFASLNCGEKGDDIPNILENRRRALAALSSQEMQLVLNTQVHGTRVHTVAERPPHAQEGDGLVTSTPSLALGVLTADCAPVLFYCPTSRVVGACHAGWQGALTGVVEETIRVMQRQGARLSTLLACIGPCIHQDSYQVDGVFRDKFTQQDPQAFLFFKPIGQEKFLFSLPGYVNQRLKQAGVSSIDRIPLDTYTEENLLFSFRRKTHRQEHSFGVQLSAIACVPGVA